MLKWKVIGLMLLFAVSALALTEIDRQELRWRNYHTNGGFESGLTGVTHSESPSLATPSIESVQVLNGNRSLKCLASQSNGTCIAKLVLIPGQSIEALLSFYYKTSGSNWQAIVQDGDNATVSTNALDASTSFFTEKIIRYNSSQGEYYRVSFRDTSSSSFVPLYVDDIVQGPAVNINESGLLNWTTIDFTGSDLEDLETKSHTVLSDIGTNTHPDIDSHIAATNSFHGITGQAYEVNDAVSKRHEQNTDTAVANGTITNTMVNDSAAIAQSKLDIAIADATHDGLMSSTNQAEIDSHIAATNAFHGITGQAYEVNDAVSKKHSQNTDTGTNSNTFNVGDGNSSTSIFFKANISGASDPYLSFSTLTNKWYYSNDGVIKAEIGSGSSSGGGGITKVANETERLDLTPTDGDMAIQLDNNFVYKYKDPTGWNYLQDALGMADDTHDGIMSSTYAINSLTEEQKTLATQYAGVSQDGLASSTFYNDSMAKQDALPMADNTHDGIMSSTYAINSLTEEQKTLSTQYVGVSQDGLAASTFYNTALAKQDALVMADDTHDGIMSSTYAINSLTAEQKTEATQLASADQDGLLSSTDYATFDGKQASLGMASDTSDGIMSSTYAINSLSSDQKTLATQYADADQDGLASSTFYNTALAKQDALPMSDNTHDGIMASTYAINSLSSEQKTSATRYASETQDGLASTSFYVAAMGKPAENVMVNPSSESPNNPWTCTNATAALSTDYAGSTTHSFKITATDANAYCTAAFNTLQGRFNNDHYLYYVTSASDITQSVYLGAALKGTNTLGAKTAMTETSHITFTTDGSVVAGTVKILLPTSGSIIYVDDLYTGKNMNVGTVAQASIVGGLVIDVAADHYFSTNGTSYSKATAAAVVAGDKTHYEQATITSTAGDFGFKMPSLEAGYYEISGSVPFLNMPANGNARQCVLAINDGTTSYDVSYSHFRSASDANAESGVSAFTVTIPYTTAQASREFTLYVKAIDTTTCKVEAINSQIRMFMKKIPSSSQTVVKADSIPENYTGYWAQANCEAYLGTSSSSMAKITDADCTTLTKQSGNLTATAISGEFSYYVNLKANNTYEVCHTFRAIASGSNFNNTFAAYACSGTSSCTTGGTRIYSTSNGTVANGIGRDQTVTVCGNYTPTSTGNHTFTSMASLSVGGGVTWSYAYGTPGSEYSVAIKNISQTYNMPQIVNSVTHSKANQQRIVRGKLSACTNTAATISDAGTGDWSVSTGASTGKCSITFSPAWPDTNYSCNATGSSNRYTGLNSTARTASTLYFEWINGATDAAAPSQVDFICIGDK